jgi:hypothetical protein
MKHCIIDLNVTSDQSDRMYKEALLNPKITKKEILYQVRGLGKDKSFKEIMIAALVKICLEEFVKKEHHKDETETNGRRKKVSRKRPKAV